MQRSRGRSRQEFRFTAIFGGGRKRRRRRIQPKRRLDVSARTCRCRCNSGCSSRGRACTGHRPWHTFHLASRRVCKRFRCSFGCNSRSCDCIGCRDPCSRRPLASRCSPVGSQDTSSPARRNRFPQPDHNSRGRRRVPLRTSLGSRRGRRTAGKPGHCLTSWGSRFRSHPGPWEYPRSPGRAKSPKWDRGMRQTTMSSPTKRRGSPCWPTCRRTLRLPSTDRSHHKPRRWPAMCPTRTTNFALPCCFLLH